MSVDQIFTLIALIFALIGLFYTVAQIPGSRKVSLADFLLKLDDHMREHDEVHLKLRPGGEWTKLGE